MVTTFYTKKTCHFPVIYLTQNNKLQPKSTKAKLGFLSYSKNWNSWGPWAWQKRQHPDKTGETG
jgi:hypothetical protein